MDLPESTEGKTPATMEPESKQDVKADPATEPPKSAATVGAPKVKSKLKKKQRKVPVDPDKPRRIFLYDESHKDMDFFGVIVEWGEKKLSHREIHNKFEKVLSGMRHPAGSPEELERLKRSIKRKSMPYFRRTGRNKGIVTFQTWQTANKFSQTEHPGFNAFIPMSFLVNIGVVYFNAPKVNIKEVFASCAGKYEIMQWRVKRLEPNKLRITFAVRGTEMPTTLLFQDKFYTVERYVRHPVRCNRCLRYGHRTASCFRRAQCGACIHIKPISWHTEKLCPNIKSGRGKVICTHCIDDEHVARSEKCVEENCQRIYKAQLAKHSMDFIKALESEIIPMVRSTHINSNRAWND